MVVEPAAIKLPILGLARCNYCPPDWAQLAAFRGCHSLALEYQISMCGVEMLQISQGHGQRSSAAAGTKKKNESTLQRLVRMYGDHMSVIQVATELNYSATYFRKKIGAADYQHLEWVKAIYPARKKCGRFWVYRTESVASFLDKGV